MHLDTMTLDGSQFPETPHGGADAVVQEAQTGETLTKLKQYTLRIPQNCLPSVCGTSKTIEHILYNEEHLERQRQQVLGLEERLAVKEQEFRRAAQAARSYHGMHT
eukprot:2084116-Amphidinium_carterae.1